MKKFQVGVSAINAEKMWDFAQANHVHVHFIRSIKHKYNPVNIYDNSIFVYEFLMAPETYTAFALSVPVVSL